jgi:hypothetical protein
MTSGINDDPILSELYRYHDSYERPVAFLPIFAAKIEGFVERAFRFWPYVAKVWSSFDAIPHREYAAVFSHFRWGWGADCMEPEARRFYDSLTPIVTLYRGANRDSGKGLSWTLDLETAKGFAQGHRMLFNPHPTIFTARVRKSSIAFCCVDREESECVLFRPPRNLALQDTARHPWVIAAKAEAGAAPLHGGAND